jgi:UDP-glucuronate 4-epimerase
MKVLITGVAGFIGSSLARKLLKNNKISIYGIDNFDPYTSKSFQNLRLKDLKKNKNFNFKKIDLRNFAGMKSYFKNKKFDYIYHFAASVGVRYSLVNPKKYVANNIVGFFNLIENIKHNPPKKVFFASSSSVYGESKKFPLEEGQKLKPINVYSYSKKNNEEMAKIYSNLYNMHFVGLRFFTVFGEWGRPDMFFLKLLKAINEKKTFYLNNSGYHFRDFTYIGDIVKILEKMLYIKDRNKFEVFNICSNKPYKLSKIINYVTIKLGNLKIKNIPINKADVIKTHGNNKMIKKKLKLIKFTNIEKSMDNTIEWFKKYKKFI